MYKGTVVVYGFALDFTDVPNKLASECSSCTSTVMVKLQFIKDSAFAL